MQVIAWKDTSLKWPVVHLTGQKNLLAQPSELVEPWQYINLYWYR